MQSNDWSSKEDADPAADDKCRKETDQNISYLIDGICD